MSFEASDESIDRDFETRCYRRELLNAVERNNYNTLYSLLRNNQYDVKEIINIKDATNGNNTLLHVALESRKRKVDLEENNKIINLLVEKGADIGTANDLGETPQQLFKKRLKTGLNISNGISASASPQVSHSCPSEMQQHNSFENRFQVLVQQNPKTYHTDLEFAPLERNPVYESSGLKLSLHGILYQLQLLMLFLHRATKIFHSFYLATELNEAAKFDDVVLRYKMEENDRRWTCRFLQAKHVLSASSSKIKRNQLFSLSDKLPFSLHKYLDSFWKIKHNDFFRDAEFQDFVICTNAELDTDAERFFVTENGLRKDEILHFHKFKTTKYKLRNSTKHLLFKNWRLRSRQQLTDNCLNEFLEKFRLITRFPNKDELNKLISAEMGEEFKLLNTDLVTNSFKNNVLDWMASYKGGRSHYLIIDNGKYFIKSIKHQIRVLMVSGLSVSNLMKLQNYNISFNTYPGALSAVFREKGVQFVHLVTDNPLLSSLKVAEFIRINKQSQKSDEIIFLSTKQFLIRSIRNLVLKSFSYNNTANLLIIHCDDTGDMNTVEANELISNKLLEILKSNSLKKVVFIAPSRYNFAIFSTFDIPRRTQKDQTKFEDLAEVSQLGILKKEVTFQGKRHILNNIINLHSAAKLLNEDVLEFVIHGNEINIGTIVDERFDMCIRTRYIDRNVSRRIIQSNILQDKQFLTSNIIILVIRSEMEIAQQHIDYKLLKHEVDNSPEYGVLAFSEDSSDLTLSEMFQSLCQRNPAVDIFVMLFQNNRLALENFRGKIDALAKYFDDDLEQDYLQEELLSYLHTDERKYSILAANPGMGKTLFLEKLSFNLKDKNPDLWVIKLSLNSLLYHKPSSHGVSLEDISFSVGDVDEAINFIIGVTISRDTSEINCDIQRKLLFLALKNDSTLNKFPRVAMLFDGFDEICPIYKEKTIALLKALQLCNVAKIWITTRTHEQHILEKELSTSAYYLNPLSKDQKIQYLRNVFHKSGSFERDINYSPNDRLSVVCQYLSEITLESPKSSWVSPYSIISIESQIRKQINYVLQSDFTDNPLHCRMLAEVLSTKHAVSTFDFDLSYLYKEFVDMKFANYYAESTHMSNTVAAIEMRIRDYQNMKVLHQELAINEIFPDTCDVIQNRFNIQALVRLGFTIQPSDGYISFIHRSFAEYFASNFIAEHFNKQKIQNILSQSTFWENALINLRVFLNRNSEFLHKLEGSSHNIFQNICDKAAFTGLLLNLIDERCEGIVKSILKHANNFRPFMLQALKENILTELPLINFTEGKRKIAALINIILFDSDIFDALYYDVDRKEKFRVNFHSFATLHKWICCYSGADSQLILDTIFRTEIKKQGYQMSEDPGTYANRCLNLLEKLLNITYSELSVLHLAAIEGKLDLIIELFSWLKKNIIGSISCNQPSEKRVDRIHKIMYNLLFMVDMNHRIFLHFVTDNNKLTELLSLIHCYFGKDTLRYLISWSDSSGQTLFHYLVANSKECAQIAQTYLVFLRDHLDKEHMTRILLKLDKERRTALHNIALSAEGNTCFRILLNFVILHFDIDAIAQLLLIRDMDEKTVLTCSLTDGDTLTTLLGYCETHFNKAFLETIFCYKDSYEQNIIHHCVQRSDRGKSVEILMAFIKKHFGKYLLEKMLFEKDFYQKTPFHYACESKKDTIVSILSFVEAEYGLPAAKKLIYTEDSSGRTCIHFAAGDRNRLMTLIDFLKIHCDVKSFHNAIFKTDFLGRTLLHHAQMATGGLFIGQILDCLKENCDETILLKSMITIDNDSKTALDINRSRNSRKNFLNMYTRLIEALPGNAGQVHDEPTQLTVDDINQLECQLFSDSFVGDDMSNRLSKKLNEYMMKCSCR